MLCHEDGGQPTPFWVTKGVNRSSVGCDGRRPPFIKTLILMIDLLQLAKEAPGTIISVPVGDLVEANKRLVETAISGLERAVSAKDSAVLLTREQVMQKLNVVPSTLWRWQKRGYLVPLRVGGENRYRSTDIDKILEGE